MNTLKDGWFSEISPMWPGQCLSLEIEEVLHQEKSNFQDIAVYQTLVLCFLFLLWLITIYMLWTLN